MSEINVGGRVIAGEQSAMHGERALGFWLYLMSDAIIFGVLFANFIVQSRSHAAGPGPGEIFDMGRVALQTALLLASSLVFGFASIAALKHRASAAIGFLTVVFLLGLGFLVLEIREFSEMIARGAGPQVSGYWSSFFGLVGTHGLHVAFGLLGLVAMIVQIAVKGITEPVLSRLYRLGLFWHFLDVIWIAIFSFVYLAGLTT
ncbi:cytochrome c oxidase subunit 3 [Labrys sp. KB_33_2]|uniref:cytochrome c oxidase subunit 3 n=1 Tax=Labrys sp. KB_33_2 TaxID=3237479 RepID=UPI003F8FF458